jgi:hypothetical protein
MYNSFNFKKLINSMACIPEYNLAILHGFNTFLLKIFRAQMGYKKGVMGANGFHHRLRVAADCGDLRYSVAGVVKHHPRT